MTKCVIACETPTFNNSTSKPALTSSGIRLLMNQLSHRVPLFSPMILMVSLSRASFSYTTPLMMMATEYIHARVMKRGMDRLITRRNLRIKKKKKKLPLTLTMSISSPVSMKFQNLGLISSHIPPRSLSTPNSWKVLFTCNEHKQAQPYSMGASFMTDGGPQRWAGPCCTSWMILCVAGVSGVYRIFPMSRGFRALQIILEMGLDSRLRIILLQ
ncbi:hypothetical protein EYF80_025417 [Liparis tanakae]|uniref:Uncharacterized protein n=1 Tax=Liparis tanakae TaxID=230148 RepID=A0A4Z2HF92_9TELE|nr:hypothetical protein EYF80_025417 [Liparis tanakae]